MASLPTPGGDAGSWGAELNEYLEVEHNGDGTHKSAVVQLKSEKGAANGYASLGAGGRVPVAQLGSGTPDGTKFLRDDGAFATPAGGGGGASDLDDLTDVAISSPAEDQVLRYNGTSFVNAYVGPVSRRLDYYGSLGTAAGFTSAWNAAAADIANWTTLVIPKGQHTYTQSGTALTLTAQSGKEILGEGGKEGCRVLRTDTDERAALAVTMAPAGGTVKGFTLKGMTWGHQTQQAGTGSGYGSAICFTQNSDDNTTGFAQCRFEDLGGYQSQQVIGLTHPNGTSIVVAYESDFLDIKGVSMSRSFIDFISPTSVGTTNNRGAGWYLDNNGSGLALTEAALRFSGSEFIISTFNAEGNDATVSGGRARLLYAVGDTKLKIGLFRAENWGLPSGEWGGAVAYVGGAQVDIDAYRFAFGAVNMAGGSTDLWEVSNVGALRIGSFRLRHAITAGTLRIFKGDASGPDIEIGDWDDTSAAAYTYADTAAGFLARFRRFDTQHYARVKAGAPTDADLALVKDGAYLVDSSNSRLYVRVGGAWKYAALT